MQKYIFYLFLFLQITLNAQTDYSDQWEDFYSYNNVKDFIITDSKIYSIVDNAVFIYDINTQETEKISSVHGLSGEETSSIYYSESTHKIIIGYASGLLEIINEDGSIHISNDIERLIITGSKKVNHITEYNNKLYLSTAFAVIEYNIQNLEFGDTFYIGDASSTVNINQITIHNDIIYAATENGIYTADVNNPNLIDFHNWTQPTGTFLGNFTSVINFNNEVYTAKAKKLYKIVNGNTLQTIKTISRDILNLYATDLYLNVSVINASYTFNTLFNQMNYTSATTDFNFKIYNSFTINDTVYLATKTFGILAKPFQDTDFTEIHPEGPLQNDVFSIEVYNNNLWVVFGAMSYSTFNINALRRGFSHYNGEHWKSTPYYGLPRDLVDVEIDKNHENRVFISSWAEGLLEVIDDEIVSIRTFLDSGLEKSIIHDFYDFTSVSGTAFDNEGNLWVGNGYVSEKIKKMDSNDNWTGYSMDEVLITSSYGIGDITIDNIGNKWLESRVDGVLVLNKSGTKIASLNTTNGLPHNKIKAIAVDRNNRIWIGTIEGMVRFDNAAGMFDSDNNIARPIIIRLEGGTDDNQGQVLLGEQAINSIAIDGADNKWFGTQNSGVLGTNPSGQKTLNLFNKDNSPLPSNQINEIRVDNSTGKVYFATAKGIVVYNNNVSPFGKTLGETYAFPNPSTKNNEFITIDGRHGTHLPRGTNVKILDSAGYLVHETNVVEGSEIKGGKVIWNKTNLAGTKVASGIYTILLTIPDASETSITKVAIVN